LADFSTVTRAEVCTPSEIPPPSRALPALLASLAALGPFSTDTMLPSMLEIGHQFGARPSSVQHILTAYLVPFALMSLWHGAISDAVGRRRVILGGLIVYAFAAVGCATAQTLNALIFWRVIQGLVAGAGTIVGRATVRDFYTGAAAQRLMSTVSVVFAIAPVIGPVVGGWLGAWFGWRAGFWFMSAMAAILLAWTGHALPETLPKAHRQSLHPVYLARSYVNVLGNPAFLAATLALALNFCGFFIYVMSAPIFLVKILGLRSTDFLWLFAQSSLGMMAGAWASRHLAGKWSRWKTVSWGVSIMAAAALVNVVFHASAPPSIPWSVLPLFFYVAGQSLAAPSLTLEALDLFPTQRGLASSCQTFVQSSGGSLGAALIAPYVWHTALRLSLAQVGLLSLGALAALVAFRLLADPLEGIEALRSA
jgi:MFS transporter, DHA1 family, multidrug resistance protein